MAKERSPFGKRILWDTVDVKSLYCLTRLHSCHKAIYALGTVFLNGQMLIKNFSDCVRYCGWFWLLDSNRLLFYRSRWCNSACNPTIKTLYLCSYLHATGPQNSCKVPPHTPFFLFEFVSYLFVQSSILAINTA